ncbi:MAG: hypothetical protein KKA67_00320 [Spirochaetes bacterium]|nr:hypothetical protein [Spirochaetota bacterium]MBU1079938.1 hypothetical protein [Spirochaetota bacterium]
MKRSTIGAPLVLAGAAMITVFFPLSATAQEEPALWGSQYSPGNLMPAVTAAVEFESGAVALTLYPQAEIVAWKPSLGGFAFFDIGIAALGRLAIPLRDTRLSIGAAVGPTFHIGLRGLDTPISDILDRVDIYAQVVFGADIVSASGLRFALGSASGVNYYVNDSLSVGLGYTDWNDFSGVGLHARLRLGPRPAVKGMSGAWESGAQAIAAVGEAAFLARFYAYLGFAFYTGGRDWAPETFTPGSGTIWRYTSSDDGASFYVERVYLGRGADGLSWWRLRYYDDSEEVLYEFAIDDDEGIVEIVYRDDRGIVRSRSYAGGRAAGDGKAGDGRAAALDTERKTASDIAALAKPNKRETVTVPAGTYKSCYVVMDTYEGEDVVWWFASDASLPGRLVKYRMTEDGDSVTAELFKVLAKQDRAFKLKK